MKKIFKVARRVVKVMDSFLVGFLIALIATPLMIVMAQQIDDSDKVISETDAFIEEHETYMPTSNYIPDLNLSTIPISEKQSLMANNDYIPEFVEEPISLQYIPEEEYVMTPEEFQIAGVIFWNNWKYTYYSEQVLPGGGLQIPGRWSDGLFVRDENGYLCVASNEHNFGDIVATPFGDAIVYDMIGDGVTGVIDIYVSW